MSKPTRSKRRLRTESPPASSGASSSSTGLSRVPRLVWLLGALLCLAALLVPVYRWRGALREQASKLQDDRGAAANASGLESLPSEPVYPSVEELRAEVKQLDAELLGRYPESASALHIVANQAAQIHQYERAADIWKRAVQLAPRFAGPRAGLAMAEMEQGNDQKAVGVLEAALAVGCDTAEIYKLLCDALQKVGEPDRAESVCRAGLQQYPDSPALRLQLGQLLLQLGELEEAKSSLLRVLELHPDSVAAHFSLATVLARLGDAGGAEKHRQRYAELKEQGLSGDARFQVVYRATLQKIVVNGLISAATEHERQGDFGAAEEKLLRALTLHPRSPDACRLLVSLYRQQKRIADAHLVQQRLVDIQPTVQNLVNLASLALPMQRYTEAESALLAALQLDPRSRIAHRSLAFLYQHTGNLAQARSHAQQLARLEPTAESYELLGQICLRMNDQAGYRVAADRVRRLGGEGRSSEEANSYTPD